MKQDNFNFLLRCKVKKRHSFSHLLTRIIISNDILANDVTILCKLNKITETKHIILMLKTKIYLIFLEKKEVLQGKVLFKQFLLFIEYEKNAYTFICTLYLKQ